MNLDSEEEGYLWVSCAGGLTGTTELPVDYQEFIGRVELSIPKAGNLAQVLTSRDGKIAAASMIALAVVLQVIAALFEDKK